jgi:glycosyltransferase involved in cell wall biosynthesis
MRIGIVTATYVPSKNGVATSTALFAQGLRALGHEVRVFAPKHPNAIVERDVIRLPGLQVSAPPDYPLLLPVGPIARGLLPVHDLDIVHTMHPFIAGHIALGWARRIGAPLLFTAHTQYHAYVHYAPTPAGPTTWALKRHVRAFAGEVDQVLAPGTAMVEVLREYGFDGPVTLLPNPVDLASFNRPVDPQVRSRLGIPPDVPLLLFVGRMGHEKGLPLLLDAFAGALAVRPELQLVMVGDGPLLASLPRTNRRNVHWVGGVAHAQVADYLLAADLFVSASTSEVLPMTFLEALAAGTPVVAVESAAARDLLGPTLASVCAPNRAALTAMVLAKLEPAALAAARGAAREVATFYAVDRRAEALAAIYQNLLARGVSARSG